MSGAPELTRAHSEDLRARLGGLQRTLLDQYPRQIAALARGLERYEHHPDATDGPGTDPEIRGRLLRVLAALSHLDGALRRLIGRTVALARSQGASWTQIGQALGTSRQAAYERFAAPRAGRRRAAPSRGDALDAGARR